MTVPPYTELPYRPDSAALFEALADSPWAMFLDSGAGNTRGRYDILVAEPLATFVTRGSRTEVRTGANVTVSEEDPFLLLRRALPPVAESSDGLPFTGGAVGYFGYDLARRIERLPTLAADSEGIPDLAVGIYDWAVVVDHHAQRAYLARHGDAWSQSRWQELVRRFRAPTSLRPREALRATSEVCSNFDRAAYGAAFRRAQEYIRNGDCYQVNLAQRFSARVRGDLWSAYRRLRSFNPAPFSAYLHLPWARVLSASPERFLQVRNKVVETKPIKGTRPRDLDPARDRALAEELRRSPKDRAENLMIVDLLRNDLGKNCETGSVHVPDLFSVESFATVHHLVSTVAGTLASDRHAVELLRDCFPGGSITGAPKVRAMEIIEELEPNRRGVYCGAIGYIGFNGDMDTNIAIRTLVHSNDELRFWAGGGLVADSTEEGEWQESLCKAAAMLRLLERSEVERVGG